jgi:hypothetical protein
MTHKLYKCSRCGLVKEIDQYVARFNIVECDEHHGGPWEELDQDDIVKVFNENKRLKKRIGEISHKFDQLTYNLNLKYKECIYKAKELNDKYDRLCNVMEDQIGKSFFDGGVDG